MAPEPRTQAVSDANAEPAGAIGPGARLAATAEESNAEAIDGVRRPGLGSAQSAAVPSAPESPGRPIVQTAEAGRMETIRSHGTTPAAYVPPAEVRIGGARRAARLAAARAVNAEPPLPSADPATQLDQSTATPADGPPAPVRTPMEWAALLGLLREPTPAIATPPRDEAVSERVPAASDSATELLAPSTLPPGPPASQDFETRTLHLRDADGPAHAAGVTPLAVHSPAPTSPQRRSPRLAEDTTPHTDSHRLPPAWQQPELDADSPSAGRVLRPSVPEAELAAVPRAVHQPEPQAEVLQETTRQFLRPLIGFDPATVKIFRGEAAARLTAAEGADALTIDEHVLLADGQPIDGPRGVALLAHELAHVARVREPRFVPPVARLGSSSSPASQAAGEEAAADNDNDDEVVAGRVERAVRRAARSSIDAGSAFDASPASVESQANSSKAPEQTAWGGLPAPWEPLPGWLTSPSPEPTPTGGPAASAAVGHSSAHATADAAGPQAYAAGDGSSAGGPQVYAAEHGRDLHANDAGETVTSETQPHHDERAVEPDLDALARQVYTVLRRRLASEQRRFG
ncbi:MAG: eCIS core domain-containing protein [Chloroflexota bacterium]